MEGLNPVEWAVLPLKRYATFGGRAPRAEYWWFYLGTVVVGFLVQLIDRMLGTEDTIGAIFNLALLVPWIAVTVRRLHDTDRSGWWLLAFVAPIAVVGCVAALGALNETYRNTTAASFTVGLIAILAVLGAVITFLVFMVLPGTEGSNRYGPDPYGPNELEEVFA